MEILTTIVVLAVAIPLGIMAFMLFVYALIRFMEWFAELMP